MSPLRKQNIFIKRVVLDEICIFGDSVMPEHQLIEKNVKFAKRFFFDFLCFRSGLKDTKLNRAFHMTCLFQGLKLILAKIKSVVSREITRNSDARSGQYKAELAHNKAQSRHKKKKKKICFTHEIQEYVRKKVSEVYGPEQIVGRAKLENTQCVSHERIYQFIWEDKKAGGKLYKHLCNKGKRYRRRSHNKDNRGLIVGRVDIGQRPAIVDEKERIGDLEIDVIIGKDHKQAILTINDRASGLLFMDKVMSKQSIQIERKSVELLEDFAPLFHTITSDNGKEFANHKNIAEL